MERRTALILIFSIFTSILILACLIIFIYRILKIFNKKQIEYLKGIEIMNLEKEKDVLNTRIEVQEETFQIIGREIHDNINQLLTLSKLNLNSIHNLQHAEAKIKIEGSLQLISESIQGLTNISRSLNTDLIKEVGITKTLNDELDRIKSFNNIKISFKSNDDVNDIEPELQLLIFRIAQESIRNAIIHGNAKEIAISLIIQKSILIFEIYDNGFGFDVTHLNDKKLSQGIKNITKRVTLVNGKFEITSNIGCGTRLYILIPCNTHPIPNPNQ